MWDVLWERESANTDVRTPDHQAALEQKLYTIIRTIKDRSVYTAYFRTCRMQLANLFWQVGRSHSNDARGANKQSNKFVQGQVKISREGRRHGLQKVLLGMLVHYPEFLEEKQDQVIRLQFAPQLGEFCDALYRLLIDEQEVSVRSIYASLKPAFYELLQDIHGEESGTRPWGYKLFLRFPVLKRDPPRDFISRCIDHFGRIIHLHEMDDDIERVKLEAGSSDDDAAMDQLLNLVRERQKEDSEIEAEAAILAEEASAITRVWAPDRADLQVAA